MIRLLLLLALAGCSPQMVDDLLAGPEARCERAQEAAGPGLRDLALVGVVCADKVI